MVNHSAKLRQISFGEARLLKQLSDGTLRRRFSLHGTPASRGLPHTTPVLSNVSLHQKITPVLMPYQNGADQMVEALGDRFSPNQHSVFYFLKIPVIGIP